jgi:hypothetical protein
VVRCPEFAALALVVVIGCGELGEPTEPADPPGEDAAAIQAWLRAGAYLDWEVFDPPPKEGMAAGARVYLSPALAESLRSGATVHPVGAAAVRELTQEGGDAPIGWAINQKVESGAGAQTWSFYEVFSTEADALPLVFERGASGCVGCHAEGADFVRIEVD